MPPTNWFVEGTFPSSLHILAAQIVVLFVKLVLVSTAIGVGFGLLTSIWLSKTFQDPTFEIVLTFGAQVEMVEG